jgi:hypothetical protein
MEIMDVVGQDKSKWLFRPKTEDDPLAPIPLSSILALARILNLPKGWELFATIDEGVREGDTYDHQIAQGRAYDSSNWVIPDAADYRVVAMEACKDLHSLDYYYYIVGHIWNRIAVDEHDIIKLATSLPHAFIHIARKVGDEALVEWLERNISVHTMEDGSYPLLVPLLNTYHVLRGTYDFSLYDVTSPQYSTITPALPEMTGETEEIHMHIIRVFPEAVLLDEVRKICKTDPRPPCRHNAFHDVIRSSMEYLLSVVQQFERSKARLITLVEEGYDDDDGVGQWTTNIEYAASYTRNYERVQGMAVMTIRRRMGERASVISDCILSLTGIDPIWYKVGKLLGRRIEGD